MRNKELRILKRIYSHAARCTDCWGGVYPVNPADLHLFIRKRKSHPNTKQINDEGSRFLNMETRGSDRKRAMSVHQRCSFLFALRLQSGMLVAAQVCRVLKRYVRLQLSPDEPV